MPENRHRTGFRGPDPRVGKATQFKSGKNGNARGRSKKKPISEAYQLIARSPIPPRMCKKMGYLPVRRGAKRLQSSNSERQVWIAARPRQREIRECTEGKIHERVDLTVNVEEDLVLRLKRAHKRMQKLKAEREAKLTNASHTLTSARSHQELKLVPDAKFAAFIQDFPAVRSDSSNLRFRRRSVMKCFGWIVTLSLLVFLCQPLGCF